MTVAAEFWPEVLIVCLVPMTHALGQLPVTHAVLITSARRAWKRDYIFCSQRITQVFLTTHNLSCSM